MEGSKLSPWEPPADMERRRLADLERYMQNNPSYVEAKIENGRLVENRNRSGGGGGGGGGGGRPPKSVGKVRKGNSNKWSLQTTLELLEEMKALVRRKNLPKVGCSPTNWTAVASNLSNPRGLEPKTFARSCQVRYENLRRFSRGDKGGIVEAEVKVSMMDYEQICARVGGLGKILSPPRTPGTKENVLPVLSENEEASELETLDDACDDGAVPQPDLTLAITPVGKGHLSESPLSLTPDFCLWDSFGGGQDTGSSPGIIPRNGLRRSDRPKTPAQRVVKAKGSRGSLNRLDYEADLLKTISTGEVPDPM